MVAINAIPVATNQGFKSFVPNLDLLDAGFLYHWLRTNRPALERLGVGATFKEVSKAIVARIKVPLPPIDQQRRIAAILDRAEELRAKRRAAIALLDQLPQAIFLEMFGDLITNPQGWPTSSLGKLVQVVGGYAFRSEDFSEVGIPIVRISNLDGSSVNLSSAARIPEERIGKGKFFTVGSGDILIAMSGATTGKIGVVPNDAPIPLLQNQRVGKFKVLEPSALTRQYLLAYLQGSKFQQFLWGLAAGAAQPNVSGSQLESAIIALPPIAVQREFAANIEAILRVKATNQSALAWLDALFASLQVRAFSGELSKYRGFGHV